MLRLSRKVDECKALVGGHRFTTSLQTLTSVPDTFLASMFSGRFQLSPDAEEVYFIDRDGTHFRHILNHLRDGSFTLSSAMTGPQRAELALELQFYGLRASMMPYTKPEQIGASLLERACDTGTKQALQAAVAQARALVVEMGSTSPWLSEEYQDVRYTITERVVTGQPVWATANGKLFMYCGRVINRLCMISDDEHCAAGVSSGIICHPQVLPDFFAPTMLPSTGWSSSRGSTLAAQYASAGGSAEISSWVDVPNMRVTVVHGLPDDDPAMAAALRQLAALA